MKKIILISLICSAFFAEAQIINIPKDTVWDSGVLKSINLDTFNIKLLGYVTEDTIIYSTDTPPPFVKRKVLDSIFIAKSYDSQLRDTMQRIADKKPYFDFLASGKFILRQNYIEKHLKLVNKTDGEKYWFLLNLAFKNGYTPEQFRNHPQVNNILYPVPVSDTTIIDTLPPP